MPTSILDLMNNVENGFDQGRARVKQSKLADLYKETYTAPASQRPALFGQIAGVGGLDAATNAQTALGQMDDRKHAAIGRAAQMILAAPEEARPGLWPQIVSDLSAEGITGMKPDYDPVAVPKMAQQIAQAYGGATGNIQSTYVDALGNRVAIMRNGQTQVLGQNAPQNQIIDTGNGFYGVNKGNLSAAPVMVGGSPQITTSEPIPPGDMPAFQAAVQAAQQGQDATFPAGGEQLMKAPPQMTPYQQAQLDISRQRLATSQAASARAADAASSAQALKQQVADEKRNKVAAAQADTIATYDDSIKRIDDLLKSPEVGTLGTYMGDAQALIPHTGARNARAALDTIRNRVLLDTISKLKALSATGASGFGALSNQEGEILKNSIASLDKAQTHDAIVAALKDIQRVMRESKGRVAGVSAQAAPQSGGWKVEVVN